MGKLLIFSLDNRPSTPDFVDPWNVDQGNQSASPPFVEQSKNLLKIVFGIVDNFAEIVFSRNVTIALLCLASERESEGPTQMIHAFVRLGTVQAWDLHVKLGENCPRSLSFLLGLRVFVSVKGIRTVGPH